MTTKKQYRKGVIINNARFGFGKEYIILDKETNEQLSPWTYNTLKDAKKEAKRKKIKIYTEW